MATFTIRTRALHPDGKTETRTYFCPDDVGYVWDTTDPWRRFQPCEGMYQDGATLIATGGTLARVIRRHLARRRRDNLREARAEGGTFAWDSASEVQIAGRR